MRKASLRAVSAAGIALIVLFASAGVASACNLPSFSLGPSEAGPGDVIRYTISDTEPGADWTLTIAGREVAAGESDGTAPSGTFVMPDLGPSPQDVPAELQVVHTEASESHGEGSPPWTSPGPGPLRYRPPVRAAPPQESSDPAAPAPAPPDSGSRVAPPPERGSPTISPRQTPRSEPPRQAPAVPRSLARQPGVTPLADPQVPERPAVPAAVETRAQDRAALSTRIPRAEAARQIALPGPQPARRLPRVHAASEAPLRVGPGDDIPAAALAAFACLLLAAAGAAAVWALRRGGSIGPGGAVGGPQWVPPGLGLESSQRDLVLEAELQELIAEERARQVAREAAAIRTGPG